MVSVHRFRFFLFTAPISQVKVSYCLIHAAAQRRIVVPQQHLIDLIRMLSLKGPPLLLLYVPYLHRRILASTDHNSIVTLQCRNIHRVSIQIIILISILLRHVDDYLHIIYIQISHINLHSSIFVDISGQSVLVGVKSTPNLVVSRALQKLSAHGW